MYMYTLFCMSTNHYHTHRKKEAYTFPPNMCMSTNHYHTHTERGFRVPAKYVAERLTRSRQIWQKETYALPPNMCMYTDLFHPHRKRLTLSRQICGILPREGRLDLWGGKKRMMRTRESRLKYTHRNMTLLLECVGHRLIGYACMYVCVCVCMYIDRVCMYVCLYVCVCVYVYTYVCMHACMYVWRHT